MNHETSSLMRQFLEEDCSPTIRHLLLAEIEKHGDTPLGVLREFTFNRFNVYFDFQRRTAKLEDELDAGEEGSLTISLTEFAAVLRQQAKEASPQ